MVCKSLLLPLMAGMALSTTNVNARGSVLTKENLASKSLSFIENKGQITDQFYKQREDIDFKLAAGNGLNIFIGDGAIHYQWATLRPRTSGAGKAQGDKQASGHVVVRPRTIGAGKAHHDMTRQAQGNILRQAQDDNSGVVVRPRTSGADKAQDDNRRTQDDNLIDMYRMDVELVGANKNAEVIAEDKQAFFERYFQPWVNTGNSISGIIARSFRKITYKNVYPNIDWVLYVKDAETEFGMTRPVLEYDFVVRPGGVVSDIKLRYGGAKKLSVDEDGSLKAITPFGEIKEHAPYSFDGSGRVVASGSVLHDNVLTFSTGDYSGTLTIDPTLEWGTYFGGLDAEMGYGLAGDGEHIYLTGVTGSVDNIATTGNFQATLGGSTDAFIARFDASGACLWATYLGGLATDRGTAIAVDMSSANIYLCGVTKSISGIATTGAHQDTLGGSYDAFLARFDSSGARIWATYYGGAGDEGGGLIAGTACDKNGNIYLTGQTSSSSNISSSGSYQMSSGGNTDAFVAKFDSSGVRQWGTYYGGESNDFGRKAGCDSLGNVYVGGYTMSISGIASNGAYQSAFGGLIDAFLVKFDSLGSLQWSGYFGGPASDLLNAIAVRPDGTVYIGGSTGSDTGIATGGVHQDTLGGSMDGFLAQFSDSGQLDWATYIGGTSADAVNALATGAQSIYIGGLTSSTTGISTPGTYQDSLNGSDAFVARFSYSGQRNWGTYYGGTGAEGANAMIVTDQQQLFVSGQTNSATGIGTSGSFQMQFGGGSYDAFLAKFNVCEIPPQPGAITGDTVLCSGQEYVFNVDSVISASFYTWTLPNGWTGSSDSTSIIIVPDENSGVLSVAANNSCATSDSVLLNLTVNTSPEPEIENNNNTLSTTQPYSSYQWNKDGQAIAGATAATYTATTDGSYSVTVTNANGCSGTSDTLTLEGVGIDELQTIRDAIRVYPNPAEDVVFIQSPVSVNVEVMDIEGRVLKAVAHAKVIHLRELAEGMYLLRIYDGEGRLVKVEKVIKQLK